jgi:hypothetical protein
MLGLKSRLYKELPLLSFFGLGYGLERHTRAIARFRRFFGGCTPIAKQHQKKKKPFGRGFFE